MVNIAAMRSLQLRIMYVLPGLCPVWALYDGDELSKEHSRYEVGGHKCSKHVPSEH